MLMSILPSLQISHLSGWFCLLLLCLALLLQFYTKLMDVIKLLIAKLTEMAENGDCDHISPEEFEIISSIIHAPRSMGRESAAKYLGVSLNRLHELRDEGIVLPPRKRVGFKELEYFVIDLKKAKEKLDKMK